MKKSLLVLFILIIIPSILAIEITLTKDIYQPQETLQAEITGNFISLTVDDILIFKGDKLHSEPVIKDLTKQNNIYYFYSILPNSEGNFTFQIDSDHLERGKIVSDPIKRDFTIKYGETSDLSFFPGFIIPNDDFEIKVKSLFKNTELTATFELTEETKEVFLIESIEEILKFSLPTSPPIKSMITLNNYQIPVFLIKKVDTILEYVQLEFIPHSLTGTITENSDYFFRVIIKNTGGKNLTDVTFSSDLDIKISPNKLDFFESNGIELINVTISVSELEQETLSGIITAKANENTFDLPILFNVTNNQSEVIIKDVTTIDSPSGSILSCNQLGNLCQFGDQCTGETLESLDGPCCIGECIEEKGSGFSPLIGIILLAVLILIVAYVIWKIRKRKKLKNPQQILKERSDSYKQRMKGEEVTDKIDKV